MAELSYADALHLLSRVGFSGSPQEIDALTLKSREDAVDALVDYTQVNNGEVEAALAKGFGFLRATSTDELTSDNFNDVEIGSWWIDRMWLTRRPFEEKMTLFWHNHFATSIEKVPVVHMYEQNLHLRESALARFDDLLLKVSQGAAMLIWLDNVVSSKINPNENFARELQELFTMGTHDVITGEANYTEDDVREVARAFTGWRFRKKNNADPFAYEWVLSSDEADAGVKTIYGKAAQYSGQDVIEILAAKPATARYLVYKLFDFFVYPLDPGRADDKATLEKFAAVYFANNHSIKELVRAIFKSREFFSDRARHGLVKTPVDFVIGTLRMLKQQHTPSAIGNRDVEIAIQTHLAGMGMNPFNPPNVAGWKMHLGFVASEFLLNRYNFSEAFVFGPPSLLTPTYNDTLNYVKGNVKKTVQNLVKALGLIELDKPVVKELQKYLSLDNTGNEVTWPPSGAHLKIRGLIKLIMCMPEFHVH
jgi:uncharacterized protein (DUF1800 family)